MLITDQAIFLLSIILFVGVLSGKVGYKYGIPALLLFLITGMLFGIDGYGLVFRDARSTQSLGVFALCIILFTGGMDTHIREIKPIFWQGVTLSTLGVLLTTLFSGLFIYWASNNGLGNYAFGLGTALILAATMSSTDSASVFAILRSQKMQLKENLKPMLELESGSNDPMALMLTLALISFVSTGDASIGLVSVKLLLQFAIGIGAGLCLGYICVWIINHINIENDMLYPILLLCLLFFIYASVQMLGGNGFLAVYVAGIVVGNAKVVHKRSINTFFDGLTWLMQIILFILLGLFVNPHELIDVALLALVLGAFVMFIARPLAVFLCLIPQRGTSLRGKVFVSWVGLRGAVPIIFATYPMVAEIPGSEMMFNVVFVITFLSLLFQGSSISTVAKWLHLDIPAPAEGNLFGVEIPEETGTQMEERTVTETMLSNGPLLMDLDLKDEELVILVRRQDRYRVPKGRMKLKVDDILLIVSEKGSEEPDRFISENNTGIISKLKRRLTKR